MKWNLLSDALSYALCLAFVVFAAREALRGRQIENARTDQPNIVRLDTQFGGYPKTPQQAGRLYHAVGIADVVRESPKNWKWKALHTHVAVSGFLTYVKREEDGDLHLRICDSPGVRTMDRRHCIVAEIIPSMTDVAHQAEHLVLGQPVTVRGIYRFDAERDHSWGEVHPVEQIEIGAALPPLEKKP